MTDPYQVLGVSRDASNDDGVDPGAQPDNKQRSQSGFRKAVEQYQIRL